MSRRDGIDIGAIIDECKSYKDTINRTKKLSEPLEAQIKEYALAHPDEVLKSEHWEAKVTVTPKEDFNEEKAIEILKENLGGKLLDSVIKTKEYIDEDALEKLIYNGDLDAKLLTSCTIEKEPTIRLTIGKIKS